MASARWGLGFAGTVLLAAVIGRAADAPAGGDGKMPREPEPPAAADAPKAAGGTVVLTEKEYQDLRDKAARAEGAARAEAPSTCKISGRVAGDIARLRVEFEFRTRKPQARVALGCTQAYPTEAKIDGHPPSLRWGADGLSVQVEEAGDHQLVLEMDLPLAAREKGVERGLDLDLPAAPTTTLDLELPAGVKRAVVHPTLRGETPPAKGPAAQEIKTEASGNGASRLKTPGLGPVERLEVTWEAQAPAAGPPVVSVTASRIVVRVDERNVHTRAEITVAVRRGQIQELQLFVPPQARISAGEGDDRVLRIADPPKPRGGPHTVHLKPTADLLKLVIDAHQPRPGEPILVGPFVVVGAFPQSGDLIVVPSGVTLDYHPRGESQYLLTQREPTEQEKREFPGNVLALHYSTLPGADKAAPLPLLQLQADRPRGVLEARLTHVLRLVAGEGARPDAWHLSTTIQAQIYRSDIDELLVRLPENYTFDEDFGVQPAAEAQVGAVEPGKRTLRVQLAARRKEGAFKLTFEGQYLAGPDADRLAVALPELTLPESVGRVLDRGAQVTVALPDNLELMPAPGGPPWDRGKPEGPHKRTWALDRRPERLEVAWRPYRPERVVNGEARVQLQGRQATVSHRLWLAAGQTVPDQLPLRVPPEVVGLAVAGAGDNGPRLEVREGAAPAVALTGPTDRDHPLVLEYSFRLPASPAEPFTVPLVWPRSATGGTTRVCVWSDPGTRPELKEGRWKVRRTEEVKDRNSYPSLVLLSDQPGTALTLGLGAADGVSLAAYRVERALIQAAVSDDGQQKYRARFLLSQIAAPSLDVELPAPLFRPNAPDVAVLFDGKKAVWRPVDEAGKETGVSRVARVQVPADAGAKPAVLEVDYTLLPGRGLLQTLLQPPQLRGDPGAAPVRWQVALPAGWVPLSQDAVGPEYGWARRGWLLALRPSVTGADFERWFAGPDGGRADEGKSHPDPSVAVWRSAPEPLRLAHVPEQAWLLVCSLTLLIVGLALALLSLPRAVFWGTLAVLGVGALVAGLFWPSVLGAVLYGCQPGALVLLPVLAIQWLLHQRYRRQVVFLPGFTRLKAGSSLVRGRPRGEPSTVDAVPPVPAGKPQTDGNAGKSV